MLPDPRESALPTCPVCTDSVVAAEASAYVAADNLISYLWTCDTCGYGFVTKHKNTLRRLACNEGVAGPRSPPPSGIV
jgi:ribosomal protein S27AE